jgi:hypothetical protein
MLFFNLKGEYMKQGFAKIVTATDGFDVLFYLGSSANQTPALHCITQTEHGLQANLGVEFDAGEHAKAYAALQRCDVAAADALRASFTQFMNERFEPSQPGDLTGQA